MALSFVAQIFILVENRKLDEKIAQSGAFYKTVLDLVDEMDEQYGRISDLHKDIYEQYQRMSRQQESILKAYEIFKDENEMLLKEYKQIGEAFAHCEERYSDIYDQWSEMTARFEDIKSGIERLKPADEDRVALDEFAKKRDLALGVIKDKDPEEYSPPVFDVDNEEIAI